MNGKAYCTSARALALIRRPSAASKELMTINGKIWKIEKYIETYKGFNFYKNKGENLLGLVHFEASDGKDKFLNIF